MVPLPVPLHLYGIRFEDPDTGTVVGAWGSICRTHNGGATWEAEKSGTTNDFRSIYIAGDKSKKAAVGGGGVIKAKEKEVRPDTVYVFNSSNPYGRENVPVDRVDNLSHRLAMEKLGLMSNGKPPTFEQGGQSEWKVLYQGVVPVGYVKLDKKGRPAVYRSLDKTKEAYDLNSTERFSDVLNRPGGRRGRLCPQARRPGFDMARNLR